MSFLPSFAFDRRARFGAAALFALFLCACQSAPSAPVIARSDATFETTGHGKSKALAQTRALENAARQCRGKTPVVLSENSVYNGVFDERASRAIEQGAAILSGALGAKTPELARDDDYEYTVRFSCP